MESDFSRLDAKEESGPLSDETSSHGKLNENDLKISSPIKRKKKVQVISPHNYDVDGENRNNKNSPLHSPKKSKSTRRKKRVHPKQNLKQVVQITDSSSDQCESDQPHSNSAQHLQLPVDQYEVTLIRRALYKSTDPLPFSNSQKQIVHPSDIGDTSLGMKLTILSGKVIVQSLVPLKDGRASPAQLTGMIHEGDVLLSIDGRWLVGLGMHLDLLIERLKPLSESINGFFSKEIRIRFAAGHGLKLLHDAQKGSKSLDSIDRRKQNTMESMSSFKFSNYALVDNLSGRQLFDDVEPRLDITMDNISSDSKENEKTIVSTLVRTDSDDLISSHLNGITSKPTILLPDFIATQIYLAHQIETSQQKNGFFTLNESFSSLLRPPSVTTENANQGESKQEKQKKLDVDQDGLLILSDAKALFHKAELDPEQQKYIDPLELVRSECRSFSSRSRFSARYTKHLLQEDESMESSSDSNSIDTSSAYGGIDQENGIHDDALDAHMNGDDMLMRLAVWNQKWKKSMVETLEAASLKGKNTSEIEPYDMHDENKNIDIQIQNLMFGSEMTQLIHKKKSVALPPDEITEVLFDLSNRVTLTFPMSVNVDSNFEDSFDDLIETEINEATRRDKEVIEATRFLIDDILPTWLQTFKPIKPSQRSVLWPSTVESSAVKTFDDDLSIESSATGYTNNSPERRVNLEDQIAHLELDSDTKNETCHLVTFYFIRKLMYDIKSAHSEMTDNTDSNRQIEVIEANAIVFMDMFGSYLKLYDAIVAATETYSTKIIRSLLELAEYDPTHIHGLNDLSKNMSSETMYETKQLSCIIHKLYSTPFTEHSFDSILRLAVKAYPDLKPWLLRARLSVFNTDASGSIDKDNVQCLSTEENMIYYRYLTLLMHDYRKARMEPVLVREWCILSTHRVTADGELEIESRLSNFLKVVRNDKETSDSSLADHMMIHSGNTYHRDLQFLLDISVRCEKYDCALEIAEEIIIDPISNRNLLVSALGHLQKMAITMINKVSSSALTSSSILKRVLVLMNSMSSHPQNKRGDPFMDLSKELLNLLDTPSSDLPRNYIISLLTSVVSPNALLESIDSWMRNTDDGEQVEHLLDILRKCLVRGLKPDISQLSSEITPNVSVSFHRVETIQLRNEIQIKDTKILTTHDNGTSRFSGIGKLNIWTSVGNGDLTFIDK